MRKLVLRVSLYLLGSCLLIGQTVTGTITGSLTDPSDAVIVAADINYEDSALYCDHCGDRIESAHAEDEMTS